MMTDTLLAGGAGYIGSQTWHHFRDHGLNPVIFDNLSTGFAEAIPGGRLVQGDLLDREAIVHCLRENPVTSVILMASYIVVDESVREPEKYYRNNLIGALNLLSAMVECGVRNIVFSSSAAVYGDPEYLPLDEKHRQGPLNPYGHTKAMIEQMIRDFAVAHGIHFVILRYFNAAGADPGGRTGMRSQQKTHLVPIITEVAAGIREKLAIFGTDYPTRDGTCVRDYIHVADLAKAHRMAVDYLERDGESLVANLGTGNGFTVREVIDMARKVTGKTIPVTEAPRRAGDSPALVANSEVARRVLGWAPEWDDLEKIVRHAWDWQQKIIAGAK